MTIDVAHLSGNFKDAYGDLTNLVPEAAVLTKDIKFEFKEKEGRVYRFPVVVQASHGFTYADPTTDGAFAINDPISMRTQDAEINGAAILLAESIGYDAITRAMTSKQAFVSATSLTVEQMAESHANRLEIATLYGRSGLGVTLSSANASATSTVVTVTVASWALGMWSGMENAQFNFYTSGGALISSGADAIFTLTSVAPDTRKLTFTGTATGITALDAATAAGASIFFRGAKTKEQYGIDQILTNTGTLFNISATDYALWRSNVHTVSGQLTMAKVLAGVSKAVSRGLKEEITFYVNPVTWADLNSELSALRRYDGKEMDLKNGAATLEYQGPVVIKIKSHLIVKQGECFGLPIKRFKRVGSTDITAAQNILDGKDMFFFVLPSNAGVGLRSYSDCSVICETPARAVKITGFTNSGGS